MVERGDRREVRPRTPTFSEMSLPPVPLLSCTCTPGTWRSTSRTLDEPLSWICLRSMMVRAPACSSTLVSLGLPSQSPVTVMASSDFDGSAAGSASAA
jgi:hypothetical protein